MSSSPAFCRISQREDFHSCCAGHRSETQTPAVPPCYFPPLEVGDLFLSSLPAKMLLGSHPCPDSGMLFLLLSTAPISIKPPTSGPLGLPRMQIVINNGAFWLRPSCSSFLPSFFPSLSHRASFQGVCRYATIRKEPIILEEVVLSHPDRGIPLCLEDFSL